MEVTIQNLDYDPDLKKEAVDEIETVAKIISDELSKYDIFYNLETLMSYIEMRIPDNLKYIQQIIMTSAHPENQTSRMGHSTFRNFNDFVPNVWSNNKIYHCKNHKTHGIRSYKFTFVYKNVKE